MMRCPSPLAIQSLVDGELPPAVAARIDDHLGRCRSCQELARDLAATGTLLRTLADVPPSPSRPFDAGKVSVPLRRAGLRWLLLPAAASVLLALLVLGKYIAPTRNNGFIAVFVEAHRSDAAEEILPEPCDFGLGGSWE